MSHRIVYAHLAVLFPEKMLAAAIRHWSLYDDRYLLLELGGDNNCSTCHPVTNREVASRDWCALAYGRHYEVVEEAVKFSAVCEGGGMRLSGQRGTSPETYIRHVRAALSHAVPFDELGGLGVAAVAEIAQAQPGISAEAVEALQNHAESAESNGRRGWRLYPLRHAKDAALLMLYGKSVPGPAWNTVDASGPRFPCEGPGLFGRLGNRNAA